jgi:hypothetical protein
VVGFWYEPVETDGVFCERSTAQQLAIERIRYVTLIAVYKKGPAVKELRKRLCEIDKRIAREHRGL